jgi:hypothetical protein
MMARTAWYFVIAFAAVLSEVVAAGMGILFPGALTFCLYLAASGRWHGALAGGAGCCVAAEIVLGRGITALPLVLLVAVYGELWRRQGQRRMLALQALSGALLGGVHNLYYRLGEGLGAGLVLAQPLPSIILAACLHAGLAALLLPVCLAGIDGLARLLDMPGFSEPDAARAVVDL